MSPTLVTLKAGDCLLYKPKGFFGRLIALKTWHPVGHVEVYDGAEIDFPTGRASWASRDGKGVGRYDYRENGLLYVLRPTIGFDLAASRRWARRMNGTPYGWADLANFVGLNVDKCGIICSSFVAGYYRAGGWKQFPEDEINDIAPFQFLAYIDHGFDKVYDAKDLR